MSELINEAYIRLQEFLLANFSDAKVVKKGRELVKRCHYCGDSRDITSKHLYIGISNTNLISYHCFKCGEGGLVDAKFFRDLGVYDADLINLIIKANKLNSNIRADNFDRSIRDHYRNNQLVNISYNDMSLQKKIAYMEKRLGVPFTANRLAELKIIPNLLDYLNYCGIKYHSRDKISMQELNIGFIGFMSYDCNYMIMRRLVPKEKVNPSLKERYTNYKIGDGNSLSAYIIPGEIDIRKPCTICMAEGPFDILSVYLNGLSKTTNTLYVACGGKTNYGNVMKILLSKIGIPYFGLNVHIYSDNDINDKDLYNFKMLSRALRIPLTVHYNLFEGEKDFGVPMNRIIDSQTIIGGY